MANQKKRIVVVGGMNMDIVAVTKELPGIGEYMYGDELHFIKGGNGLNQAVAAARLGGVVSMVGFVGDDGFGKELTHFLEKEGVATGNVKTIKTAQTGTVLFMLTGKVERHVVYPGSNMKASVADLSSVDFTSSDIVISQLTIPQEVIAKAFEKARKAGGTTMLNLFPNYEVSKELLKLCDHIILNEVELAFRTGNTEFVNAQHKDLHMDKATVLKHVKELRTSADQVIITTLAERGAMVIKKDEIIAVEGIKVKFADATGAGDCFLGAFATAMAEGKAFKDSLMFANAAAALSVQKIGATTSFPTRAEADAFLKKQG